MFQFYGYFKILSLILRCLVYHSQSNEKSFSKIILH